VSHEKAVVDDVPEVYVAVRSARDESSRVLLVDPRGQEHQLVHRRVTAVS